MSSFSRENQKLTSANISDKTLGYMNHSRTNQADRIIILVLVLKPITSLLSHLQSGSKRNLKPL